MAEWTLYYEDWVIGDGEPDRDVGDTFKWFAVEFSASEQLVKATDRTRSAVPLPDYKYRVVAEVTFLSDTASVIDFGLTAIRTRDLLPADCKQGDYVTGEIRIGLPLATDVVPSDVMATLSHNWQVNRISADLTPYTEVSPRFFVRDSSRI